MLLAHKRVPTCAVRRVAAPPLGKRVPTTQMVWRHGGLFTKLHFFLPSHKLYSGGKFFFVPLLKINEQWNY